MYAYLGNDLFAIDSIALRARSTDASPTLVIASDHDLVEDFEKPVRTTCEGTLPEPRFEISRLLTIFGDRYDDSSKCESLCPSGLEEHSSCH